MEQNIKETNSNDRQIKPSNNPMYLFIKRLFDILASGLFLLLFGWIILILMLIKWLEDLGGKSYVLEIKEDENGEFISNTNGKRYNCKCYKNPNGKKDLTVKGPIYTSERIGKGGKPIKFHKIRSMCPGAQDMKQTLIDYGFNESNGPVFKIKNDPRITKFGKFLRKTSLDELPQIWDIFIGRLSIVGPRPPLRIEVEKYNDYQMHRLDVKGGLLCLWQITKNRNQLSFDEWVELDIKYIENRSLWLDFKIIIKAVWFVLTDRSGE